MTKQPQTAHGSVSFQLGLAKAILSDANVNLVDRYQQVRDNPHAVLLGDCRRNRLWVEPAQFGQGRVYDKTCEACGPPDQPDCEGTQDQPTGLHGHPSRSSVTEAGYRSAPMTLPRFLLDISRLLPQAAAYHLSRSILGVHACGFRDRSATERLDLAWKFIQRHPFLFSIPQSYKNRFRKPWQNVVFSDLLTRLNHQGAGIAPRLKVHGNSTLQEAVESGKPIIVLTVHTGFLFSTLKAISEPRQNVAFLAVKQISQKWLEPYDLENEVEFITANSGSLLACRNALRRSMIVMGSVDFTVKFPGSLDNTPFVSVGLFELGLVSRAQIIYAYSKVDQGGIVHCYFEGPGVALKRNDAQSHARDFLEFVDRMSGTHVDRRIVTSDSTQIRRRVQIRNQRQTRRLRRIKEK